MKTFRVAFYQLAAFCILFSSCATIVGGSRYNAHIVVNEHPAAKSSYHGVYQRAGNVTVKVKRSEADRFTFTVKEEGCPEQKYTYTHRTFRGFAFAFTILGWTGVVNGIPIPWGVMMDLATGAV